MAEYAFVTTWRLDAPVEPVWDAIVAAEAWPTWWRAVVRVEVLERGDDRGIGALQRQTWRTALPYGFSFTMRTTRVEPLRLIEGQAVGDLEGLGRWTFLPEGKRTVLRNDWIVRTNKPWMNLLAPLARPAFGWNHTTVMRWGEEGLARLLAAHHSHH
ncbi:MAG: SRPBCC family protein [Chloroflexi bacterium OHK40]